MKANQTLRNDEEAVSPVIGVILMVAITVVLAAVVFVLVTKLSGSGNQNTPVIGFGFDDSNARTATVNSAPNSISWGDITVTCSAGTAAAETADGTAITIHDPNTTTTVAAGDVVSGCDAGATLTLTYIPSNGIIASHKFP